MYSIVWVLGSTEASHETAYLLRLVLALAGHL